MRASASGPHRSCYHGGGFSRRMAVSAPAVAHEVALQGRPVRCRSWAVPLLVLAGCARFGFEPRATDIGATDHAALDGPRAERGRDGTVDLPPALDGSDAGPMPSCGDPAVMARYPTCSAACDEASCVAAGGTWGRAPSTQSPSCVCQTGQQGCSCARRSDCLAGCFVNLPAPSCAAGCVGQCVSSTPTAPCWCYLDDNGQIASCPCV